jgi:hypothetical protein
MRKARLLEIAKTLRDENKILKARLKLFQAPCRTVAPKKRKKKRKPSAATVAPPRKAKRKTTKRKTRKR